MQELTAELRRADPEYQPWMITVTYEVEKRPPVRRQDRFWPLPR